MQPGLAPFLVVAAYAPPSVQAWRRGRPQGVSLVRERVLHLVRVHPGLPVGVVGDRLGISVGTLHYHLAALVRHGLIETRKRGRRRLVFPTEVDADPRVVAALALLRGHTCAAIARDIARHAPTELLEIIARVGGSPRAVYYHVKSLRECGLISSALAFRYRQLAPTPLLQMLLERLDREEADAGSA